jgi:hypothetical protein
MAHLEAPPRPCSASIGADREPGIDLAREDLDVKLALCLAALVAGVAAGGLRPPAGAAAPADESPSSPMEKPDDPPLQISGPRFSAPSARPLWTGASGVQVNVNAGGNNIVGDAANEPTIAVDPTNPNRMVIAWRQFDTVVSNFRQAGWAFSVDAGRSWRFPGVLEPGVFRSDPVLAADADGNFHYSSLQGTLEVDLFHSSNGGASWSPAYPAYGGDKQWLVIDRTGGAGHGFVYQAWSTAGGCCGTNIFNRSTDGGFNFSEPVAIPSSPIWGTLDVGPDGSLYVGGAPRAGTALVAKSTTMQYAEFFPFFDFTASFSLGGTTRANGGFATPNPDGLLGQMWLVTDHSSGPTAGWVYVCAAVDPPGTDPLDVMFARSTDGGATWSAPVRVNDDVGAAWQWFATMSVAPNGRLDVVWNDTRNTGLVNSSQLYYASSSDGGQSWSANQALSPTWNSHVGFPNQNKIGDYYHMVSDAVGASLAWSATFNGEQDVWFMRIGDYDCNGNGIGDGVDIASHTSHDWNGNIIPDECEDLDASDAPPAIGRWTLAQNTPNPFNPRTEIGFEAPAAGGAVALRIFDVGGRTVRTLHAATRFGHNTLVWDGADDAGRACASGVYLYRLDARHFSATRRMVLVR